MMHTWRMLTKVVVGLALIVLPGTAPAAGQADVADRLLQEALTKEVVERDQPAAIKLYQQVLATAGVSAATAARARERLAVLVPPTQGVIGGPAPARGSSSVPRRVLDGEWTELYDMSADGRLVVGQRVVRVGTQELVVRDLSTGVPRVLAIGGAGPELSNDGTLVAYGTANRRTLNVVGTTSGAPRVVMPERSGFAYRAADFAPDGRSVLVEIHRENADGAPLESVEYAWVSVADLSVRSIRVFERWAAPVGHPAEPEVSPDGRWLAFVAAPAADTQDQYVYVMDAEGKTIEPVVSASGRRAWPKWTPDGRHIVFTEEHSNGAGVWSISVENGRATGQPRLVYGNIGGDSALLGITGAGVLHFRRNDVGRGRYAGSVSHVVSRTLATAGSQERPITFRGCCAAWSPDGQRLALLGTDSPGVVVRNVGTGQERSYQVPGVSLEFPPTWFPDGSAFMVVGRDEAFTGPVQTSEALNYYRIEVNSGAVRRVTNVGLLRSWQAAVSRDNRTVYMAKRDEPDGLFTQIIAVDVAAGTETRVVPLPNGIILDPEIVISPDGTTLAIGAIEGRVFQSDGRLFTVKIDGTDFRDVGRGGITRFWRGSPLRWTPDGRSLLLRTFDSNLDWQIMRIPADGGSPQVDGVSYLNLAPLVPDIRMVRANFNGLDVSPDGTRLVISTLTAPKFEVWALDGLLSAPPQSTR